MQVNVNLAGLPALVVPCGFVEGGSAGLPVGLQMIGSPFSEVIKCYCWSWMLAHQYHLFHAWQFIFSFLYFSSNFLLFENPPMICFVSVSLGEFAENRAYLWANAPELQFCPTIAGRELAAMRHQSSLPCSWLRGPFYSRQDSFHVVYWPRQFVKCLYNWLGSLV